MRKYTQNRDANLCREQTQSQHTSHLNDAHTGTVVAHTQPLVALHALGNQRLDFFSHHANRRFSILVGAALSTILVSDLERLGVDLYQSAFEKRS